jgi:DNA-binding NarL/FixJ family response regulator
MFSDKITEMIVELLLWLAAGAVLMHLLVRRRARKLALRSRTTLPSSASHRLRKVFAHQASVSIADWCGWLSFVDRDVIDKFRLEVAHHRNAQHVARGDGAVRILVYSPESILVERLTSVLAEEGFNVLPLCGSVESLLQRMATSSPDLVLMDLAPQITGTFLRQMNHGMINCKVVLWVNQISPEVALQAKALGVHGILSKGLHPELLVKRLQRMNEGEVWLDEALKDSFLSAKPFVLTKREGQLVGLLSQGLSNKEIAANLMMSEGTVKVYVSRLFQKVGVKNRQQLALFGVKNLQKLQLTVGKGQLPEPLVYEQPFDLRSLFLHPEGNSFRKRLKAMIARIFPAKV